MIQKTLVLIKPEGVQKHLTGKIIQRFEDAGLKIIGMKMIWIDKEFASKHYSAHKEKPFYKPLEEYITQGPVVAMILEGSSAVENVRKIVGGTEPKSAPPGTIRGDFAHGSYNHFDSKEIAVKNLIHASGNEKEAEQEIKLWFKPEELHTYKTVQDLLF